MSSVPVDTTEAPAGWSEANADEVSNADIVSGSVLIHETGAQIAVDEDSEVRFYFPSGRISLFKSPDNSRDVVAELAEKYHSAVALDQSMPADEQKDAYFAVINEASVDPLTLCSNSGMEPAVYNRATVATIVGLQLKHKYDNPAIKTVRMDKSELSL